MSAPPLRSALQVPMYGVTEADGRNDMSDFGRWGNWDTREVWLWLNNDEYLYTTAFRLARRMSSSDVARELPTIFREGYPLFDLGPKDGVDMDAVDWQELADALEEEVTEEAEA